MLCEELDTRNQEAKDSKCSSAIVACILNALWYHLFSFVCFFFSFSSAHVICIALISYLEFKITVRINLINIIFLFYISVCLLAGSSLSVVCLFEINFRQQLFKSVRLKLKYMKGKSSRDLQKKYNIQGKMQSVLEFAK